MNNKKGFTLVEIIVVIALIGVIMVLVVPNVVKTFEQAKKSAFVTQGQRVIKSMNNVLSDYLADGMPINSELFFVDDETKENLEMPPSFGDRLRADNIDSINYIGVFENGKLAALGIADDNYCYTETINPSVTNIGKGIKNIDETKVVTGGKLGINFEESSLYCTTASGENITNTQEEEEHNYHYVYWNDETSTIASNALPSVVYDDVSQLHLYGSNYIFIRSSLSNEDNSVLKHEACILYNNKTFCIDSSAGDKYLNNVEKLRSDLTKSLGTAPTHCESEFKVARCDYGVGEEEYPCIDIIKAGYYGIFFSNSNDCTVMSSGKAYCSYIDY